MSIKKYETSFAINSVGEETGDTFAGKFTVKTRLTHGERLAQDAIRRQLLGVVPTAAGERAANTAEILSNLQIRIVDAPSWWLNSSGGVEIYDDNIIIELYTAAMKAEADAREAVKKAAEDAKKDLSKETASE